MIVTKLSMILRFAILLVIFGWASNPPSSLAADKTVKVHILYTSDAVGYYEPCG
ncbi:MAG: hypothetical protein ONB44_02235 [candidate division KSB1 bacterium]|nr:hypothetical protein [candidate division KSB1 bacterium]MDZ7300942.1 hypothetical protein [candidate division KSB1 bacterium]